MIFDDLKCVNRGRVRISSAINNDNRNNNQQSLFKAHNNHNNRLLLKSWKIILWTICYIVQFHIVIRMKKYEVVWRDNLNKRFNIYGH